MATWCGSPLLSSGPLATSSIKELRQQVPLRLYAVGARATLDNRIAETESKRVQSATAPDPRKIDLGQIIKETSTTSQLHAVLDNAASFLISTLEKARTEVINSFVDVAFRQSDEINVYFNGNFAPVAEIGEKTPVKIISGEVPKDFPAGVYIRNGPNPQFGGKITTSPFGKSLFHWFEGDGMLHATYFNGGEGSLPTYLNKFVGTPGYKLEKKRGKPTYLATLEGSSQAIAISYLLNQLRFGVVNKTTCNTAVFEIGGKIYANAEAALPYEINPWDLSTLEEYSINGAWDRPFTSHPKRDPNTGETVVFGFAAVEPYFEVGVISADGARLVHKVDLGFDRSIFTHDVAITERYSVILDWPLVVDVDRLVKGGNLLSFEGNSVARVGVMPRYGDGGSVQWFPAEMNYTFHVLNSYEDGDEVVLLGMRSRVPILPSRPGMDKLEWFARGMTPCKIEDAAEPWVDGALFTRLHEWRIHLKAGTLVERDLTGDNYTIEMPRVNDKYMSKKNRYGYCNALNTEASKPHGMPKYGKLLKLDLASVPPDGAAAGSKDLVSIKEHNLEPNQYASEPLFVARPGGVEEDDGWIVTYLHNETTNISEMVIIDAQKFGEEPVVRMQLPQRVPYGFHSIFVPLK